MPIVLNCMTIIYIRYIIIRLLQNILSTRVLYKFYYFINDITAMQFIYYNRGVLLLVFYVNQQVGKIKFAKCIS